MSTLRWNGIATLLSAVLCTFALQVAAAEPKDDKAASKDGENLEEVIVTGTMVRGIAPPGTNVIGVTQKEVQSTGATTSSELLRTIPQMGSFNAYQGPKGEFNDVPTSRPNLRNLPGFTTAGGSSTLILVDGRRLVGMGVQSTSPDPDVVPPGLMERVEIVPDGGSAIYGSDAVAGVINFITKRKFDGVAADARYGRGDKYNTFDANLTGGTDLGKGSVFFSYNFSRHDVLYGRDRDYVHMVPGIQAGVPSPVPSLRCSPGTVQTGNLSFTTGAFIPTTSYKLPFTTATAVPNTFNGCDESDNVSMYPGERRHSFYAGYSQDLGSRNKFDVRGFVMDRKATQTQGDFLASQVVSSLNFATLGPLAALAGLAPYSPFTASHIINPAGLCLGAIGVPIPCELQQVWFRWGGPDAQHQDISLKTWGVAPTLTTDLGHGWQLRSLASFSYSRTQQVTREPASTTNAIVAGLFNPYDWASSDPATLNALINFGGSSFGITRQRMLNIREVFDGDLFSIPGGAVKLAAGLEYVKEQYAVQKGNAVPGYQDSGFPGITIGSTLVAPAVPALPVIPFSRNTTAEFAELVLPFVSNANSKTGIKELTLSVSGRHDEYSDVGGTTNPKFGLTYKPLNSLKFRGAWGKSFVAPSLANRPQADPTSVIYVPRSAVSFLTPPASLQAPNGPYPVPTAAQTNSIILLGSAPGLKSQSAKTLSLGLDYSPPFVDGLILSATYWKIEYNDVIALPDFTNQINFWANFGQYIVVSPTPAQLAQYEAQAAGPINNRCSGTPACVYAILDARKTNLGTFRLSGWDFSANYAHPTGFGSVNFGANMNYELNREQSPAAGAPFADQLSYNVSKFRGAFIAGAQFGQLHAQATLNHTQGYRLNPPVGLAQQTHVSSYDVLDLFFKYDFKGDGGWKDLAATLNINNALDRDPPNYQDNNIVGFQDGYANGWTIGRVVQLGISKKF
jgi:iron complex outermembrane recepter protein